MDNLEEKKRNHSEKCNKGMPTSNYFSPIDQNHKGSRALLLMFGKIFALI